MHKNVVTLTTDWGLKDYYLAAVKGKIISSCPDTLLVDISHAIDPFDFAEAAFVLKNAFPYYPKGSWHLVEVGMGFSVDPYIIMNYKDHFFMGCDNGWFSLLLNQELPDKVYEINNPKRSISPINDFFIPLLAQIFDGYNIENIATQASLKPKRLPYPIMYEQNIRGKIVYIDNFENIFTNIHRDQFEKQRNGATQFDVFVGGAVNGNKNNFYHQNVQTASLSDIILFFVNDFLVVGIKQGNAAGLLSGKKDEDIEIRFL